MERLAAPGTKGPPWSAAPYDRKADRLQAGGLACRQLDPRPVLRDDCPDTGCGIKVFWREVFLRLPFFTGMHRYLPALFQTYGREVAYVPVTTGRGWRGSKYNNLDRALLGLYDLVGVSWLRRVSFSLSW